MPDEMFDGREMRMLHDMFRREFTLVPGVVRRAEPGDRERARVVGDHIDGVTTVLHHHHAAEDQYIWPLLLERCSGEVAELVGLMEAQHEAVATLAAAVQEAVGVWRAEAGVEANEALAVTVERLLPVLREHLSSEEERVVPLMENHIRLAEWNEMVRAGAEQADPEGMPLGFGMLMYEGDPEVVDAAVANMPPAIRPVIRSMAAQAYASHSELIHGTATPPRSTEL